MGPRLYDCFTFFDELDLLEIRLNELYDVVDRFVLVEASSTFQGVPKPLIFEQNKARFARWIDKIKHVVCDFPDPMPRLSSKSRKKQGERAIAWDREYYQRNQILRGLADARPDDVIMVSDVDEIPSRAVMTRIMTDKLYEGAVINLFMPYYRFYLNCKVPTGDAREASAAPRDPAAPRTTHDVEFGGDPDHDQWNGPHLVQRRALTTPNNLRRARNDATRFWRRLGQVELGMRFKNWRVAGIGAPVVVVRDGGWHFSSLGGFEAWRRKVESFSHVEYKDMAEYQSREGFDAWFLKHRIVDVQELPGCVKADRTAWRHLLFAAGS
jgi:beta-1,4-mannosyl-glycoprotein beta-1,4-N-acetylglucosaminyltransferase